MQNSLPVLIVGAGPTGLTMAIELNRYGIPFRIVDKQIKPVAHSNALAVQPRTLYAWQDMGLLPEALSRGNKVKGMNLFSHNKKIARINLDLLEGDLHFILGLSQHETEKMLLEHLREKNILVEMEMSVIDLQEREQDIKVILQHKDGQQEELNTEWLMACDGGHSFVRQKLGIPFEGKELTQHFVMADAEVQSELAKNEGHIFISDQGIFLYIPFNEKYARLLAEVSKDPVLKAAKSLTYDQVKQLAQTMCPVPLNISEPIWTSGFWIHENIVANYRHNRIFFAGDTAHLHSPAGGQGMNTGIQDAYNIAWKLALVVQKKAKPVLLDTYQAERYPVAKDVLRNTTLLTKAMTTHNYFFKKLRDFFISHLSKMQFIQKKLVDTLTQLRIFYANSRLVKDCIPQHSGPKAGTFKADIPTELGVLMQGSGFVLLLFAANLKQVNIFIDFKKTFKYAHLVKFIYISDDISSWNDVGLVDANLDVHKSFGVTQPSLYLIRPDKYIGFRGELKHKEAIQCTHFSYLN